MAAGAEQQGRLWPFLEAFYATQGEENSGYVTDDFLRQVAQAAGVDADKALAYAKTAAAQERLNRANARRRAARRRTRRPRSPSRAATARRR